MRLFKYRSSMLDDCCGYLDLDRVLWFQEEYVDDEETTKYISVYLCESKYPLVLHDITLDGFYNQVKLD